MIKADFELLRYFSPGETNYYGLPVKWEEYSVETMIELDRLRHELGSPCRVIRGSHGVGKESAVDAVFPSVPFDLVVLALMRSGFSKGLYEGGSIHLDTRKRADGLLRCWIGFKPERRGLLLQRGLTDIQDEVSGWVYYRWGLPTSWSALLLLIDINTGQLF